MSFKTACSSIPTQTFLIALFCSLLSMGLILTDKWTLSARSFTHEVLPASECRLGEAWTCQGEHHNNVDFMDSGAVAWMEISTAYFLHDEPLFKVPLWNPYIGSGYPQFLDGHNRSISPSRIWSRLNPSEQGRDILIFLRVLFWVWGIVIFLKLAGLSRISLLFSGFFATMIPYTTGYLDHVFLDVDMMVPWLFVWAMMISRVDSARDNLRLYIFSSLLGTWIGVQAFVQSQITFGFMTGILILLLLMFLPRPRKKIALYSGSLLLLGISVLALPQIWTYYKNLPNLVSSRLTGSCMATLASGLFPAWTNSIAGFTRDVSFDTILVPTGLALILIQVRIKKFHPLILFYLITLSLLIWGLPSLICGIPGLSGVRFHRHLLPYAQVGYFLLCLVAMNDLCKNLRWRKISFVFLFLLCIFVFRRRAWINELVFKGQVNPEIRWNSSPIPESSAFYLTNKLSNDEDRRHFSPDDRLFPNFSAALRVMDLRLLPAFFPQKSYELLSQVYPHWENDGHLGKLPDRFTGPTKDFRKVDESMSRLLAVNRVSMISFEHGQDYLPEIGLYSKQNCNMGKDDGLSQLWICPQIGGIGYFPRTVYPLTGPEEFLNILDSLSAESLLLDAYLFHSVPVNAGAGEIKEIHRDSDEVIYTLQVTKAGLFVFADTWFPGWKVQINGTESKLLRVNHAWKGVMVPEGSRVQVRFHFAP